MQLFNEYTKKCLLIHSHKPVSFSLTWYGLQNLSNSSVLCAKLQQHARELPCPYGSPSNFLLTKLPDFLHTQPVNCYGLKSDLATPKTTIALKSKTPLETFSNTVSPDFLSTSLIMSFQSPLQASLA